VNFNFPV